MAEAPTSAQHAQPPARGPMAHRVHSSCDRCRSRKTKCIDPVPGPCRYCARTGAVCSMATPRRKRPYYHVTEEEYQCSMRILQHFFPNRELNQQSLRAIAKDIADGTFQGPPSSSSPKHSDSSPAQEHTPSEGDRSTQEPETETESVNDLHEPLGCMMRDSRGKFRYVGAHSEIPFNAAVVALGTERKSKEIIPSPKVGVYPPPLPPPADVETVSEGTHYYMPPQELCSHYVSRFLADVHCTYWLYPVEGLLRRIDETYSDTAEPPSSSWICSLYGIFAIGAANYEQPNGYGASPQSVSSNDEKNSEDYIALARQLIPSVYDEADIDSIRALTIMSLARENMCSRVSSYLYMGASIQMAYSLGLHRDPMPESGASMEREQNRRIWWTLFILDQEVASRGGSPTLIDERHLQISTPFPSEQILYPGLDTPPSWLSTSVSLCRLKREIIQTVYTERSPDVTSVSFSTISGLLLSLQKWHQQIPPHLKHDVPLPPTQKRSVAALHLQYWGTTILLTRPFLLNLVLKHGTLDSNKKIWFDRMGKTCIDAAQKSIAILQQMAADNLLSSLTAADSTCILRITMIFILAYAHTKMHHYRTHMDTAMSLIRGMERIGFCKMVAEETPIRLTDLGIMEDRSSEDMLDVDIVTQLWGNFDPNFLNPLHSQQTLDLAFDDAGGTFDLNSEMLQFTSLDDSIVIDPSQAYPGFGMR